MPDLPNPFVCDSADAVNASADEAAASNTPPDAAAEPLDEHRFELDDLAFMIETMERPFFIMREST